MRALTSNPGQRAAREPLFDVHPQAGVSIEVFFSDRTLETFGRCGPGWFWWPRRRGFSPAGSATGPFATSYAAYRHAMKTPAPIAQRAYGRGG
jgi:hypothetical protein